MVDNDVVYLRSLLAETLLQGPVLELGAGYGGGTSRHLIESAGMVYKKHRPS